MILTRLLKFFLLVIVLTLNFNYNKVHAQKSCTTQQGQAGTCVPLVQCTTITLLIEKSPRPLPSYVAEFIRRTHCGTFNEVHHVCCETNRIDNGSTNKAATIKQTTPRQQTNTQILNSGAKIRRSSEVSERQIQSGMNILDKLRTQCGKSDADKISNGEDANLSEYPWMALLVYSDGVERTIECGGSLITDRYVLTAAHCIQLTSTAKKFLISVQLGEHDRSQTMDCVGKGKSRKCAPPIQEIDVEEAIVHKDFKRVGFLHDIGLIRLVKSATFVSNVRPVCLPITPRSMAAELDMLIIAGWGLVETGKPATILQKAVVPLRENDYCDKTIKIIKLTENHLCAGGGDKKIDTCLGDSGGPIFYTVPFRKGIRYVQYGVVSGGSKVCGLKFPSIFANVKKYLPWIAGNLSF